MISTNADIRRVVTDYFKDKPVARVWLFGSYARNEADEKSDIDLLVEIIKDSGVGLRYLTWHEDIEPLIKRKVDVISAGGLSEYVKPFIDADKLLIYEK